MQKEQEAGEAIKAVVQKMGFPWESRLKKGAGHFHLPSLVVSLPAGTSLDEGLKERIGLFFEKRVGEESLVDMCLEQLVELLKEN